MRIIYIMGPGRGGSTLLERVLNSAPAAFALGEFHTFWRIEHKDLVCSCGSPVPRCSFWNEVIETAGVGRAELNALRRGEDAIVRTKYLVKRRFSLPGIAADPAVRSFIELQRVLFETISTVSGCETLVDSSKATQRAWILATMQEVSILRLYRNATDTIVSWRLPKWDKGLNTPMRKMSIQRAAFEWWRIENFGRRLGRSYPITRINYEEFVASPKDVLNDINDESIRDLTAQIAWLDERTVNPSQCYHSLNGNPDRYETGPITIGPPKVRHGELPSREVPLIRAVGGLLTALYH
ncbi:MAG TPA: sulfotransferase [Methylocella sp.]|nr:sulfotransferase [Methylocella sp.]